MSFLALKEVLPIGKFIRKNTDYIERKENIMKEGKALSIFGLAASVIGFLASLMGKWVDSKKQEETIQKEVVKAVENHFKNSK